MKTLFHGKDDGFALVSVVVLLLVLSMVLMEFISFTVHSTALTQKEKNAVFLQVMQQNEKVIEQYDAD